MGLPILASKDLEALADKAIVAIRFEQNKKANFHFALRLFGKATLYQVDQLYLATFDQNQFRLLNTILHEIREWKSVTIYANGRPHTSKFSMINWLDCYIIASDAGPANHCREVIPDPFTADASGLHSTSLTIDIFGSEFRGVKRQENKWSLPCKFLKPSLNFYTDDEPRAKEKLEALSVKSNCNLCPYFRSEDFKPVSP